MTHKYLINRKLCIHYNRTDLLPLHTFNLVDGNNSDLALNNKGFWFTVDLGKNKLLTGIKTNHYGSAYAPRKVEILQSEDGVTWKSLSSVATSGATQYLTFISPITTRFLKYQIL